MRSPIATPVVGAVGPAITPVPVPTASPTSTPTVPRVPITFDVVADHKAVFAHELKVTWCASAGVQMVLATLHHGNTSNAFQREIQGRVREWESYKDSHNGDWGPIGDGSRTRRVRGEGVRGPRLPDSPGRSARRGQGDHEDQFAGDPAGLEGCAHLGDDRFQGRRGPDGLLERQDRGTYIQDPWYPDISSIWGPSDPPGTFQNNVRDDPKLPALEASRGQVPGRDGLYITVLPTIRVSPPG